MTRRKVRYDIDASIDIFGPLSWPDSFLKDSSYALLRPLYERTSPWRSSWENLSTYLMSQARRLGGKRYVITKLNNLSALTSDYEHLTSFLRSPFERPKGFRNVFYDLDLFLLQRFVLSHPWEGHEIEDKKKLKYVLARIPTLPQLENNDLVQKVNKECPELLQRYNVDLLHHILSSPVSSLSYSVSDVGFEIMNTPVFIGRHYKAKDFDLGSGFYRILGNFSRWDKAKVVIFKECIYNSEKEQKELFLHIKNTYGLRGIGLWKRAQVEGEDYLLSLLVGADVSERMFMVSQWELNCPQLTIL